MRFALVPSLKNVELPMRFALNPLSQKVELPMMLQFCANEGDANNANSPTAMKNRMFAPSFEHGGTPSRLGRRPKSRPKCGGASSPVRGNAIAARVRKTRFPAGVAEIQRSRRLLFRAKNLLLRAKPSPNVIAECSGFFLCIYRPEWASGANRFRRWRHSGSFAQSVPVPDGGKSVAMICDRNIVRPICRRRRTSPLPPLRTPMHRRGVLIEREISTSKRGSSRCIIAMVR